MCATVDQLTPPYVSGSYRQSLGRTHLTSTVCSLHLLFLVSEMDVFMTDLIGSYTPTYRLVRTHQHKDWFVHTNIKTGSYTPT